MCGKDKLTSNGRGRQPNPEQAKARKATYDVLVAGSAATNHISEASGVDIDQVRRALRYMEKNGIVECIGKDKSGGQGQPAKIWKLVE